MHREVHYGEAAPLAAVHAHCPCRTGWTWLARGAMSWLQLYISLSAQPSSSAQYVWYLSAAAVHCYQLLPALGAGGSVLLLL